jgi:hypothetical protein
MNNIQVLTLFYSGEDVKEENRALKDPYSLLTLLINCSRKDSETGVKKVLVKTRGEMMMLSGQRKVKVVDIFSKRLGRAIEEGLISGEISYWVWKTGYGSSLTWWRW